MTQNTETRPTWVQGYEAGYAAALDADPLEPQTPEDEYYARYEAVMQAQEQGRITEKAAFDLKGQAFTDFLNATGKQAPVYGRNSGL